MAHGALQNAILALEHLAARGGHSLGRESGLLDRQLQTVSWLGGIRQEGPASAPFIDDRPMADQLSEDDSKALGRLLTAAYHGFFDAAAHGMALTNVEETSRIFGGTVAANYPEASPAFLQFATTYWTLKCLLKRLQDLADSSATYHMLNRVDELIGPLFFPYDGPLAHDPDEREQDQNRFLESFGPQIDRAALQQGNPILIRDRRDLRQGRKKLSC